MTKPWTAPMIAPATRPNASVTIHVYGWSKPSPNALGIHSACSIAISIPVSPRTDPIERSMLRETMMSTMPVAMIATEADWTDRFQRLRGVRNRPPDSTLKPTQITTRAAIIPSSRVSSSRLWKADRTEPRAGSLAGDALGTAVAWVIATPRSVAVDGNALGRSGAATQGADHVVPARYWQAVTVVSVTPWQSASLVIQPASTTRLRLSLRIGIGASSIEATSLPPGVVNGAVPGTAATSLLAHRATAAVPAALPSSRASFQTSTVCVPRATRLRAA